MSTAYFDRQDPKSAKAVFEWALPNSEERLEFLKLLASAIKYVHDIAPAAWSVTLHKSGNAGLLLNVGPCEALTLYPDGVQLVLAWIPEDFEQTSEIYVQPCSYISVDGEKWHVWLPSQLFAEYLLMTYDAHTAFIQRAVTTKKGNLWKGSPWSNSFSSAVPKYLSQVLGIPLYLPSWYAATLGVESDSEELESNLPEFANVGAGFGLAENNRLVEEKAVFIVKNELEQSGWSVESVEHLNVGYDLLCKRNDEELHVEVKGISGSSVTFIITPNELRSARIDKDFMLYAVAKVLTETPVINIFSGDEIERKFRLEPTAFRAVYTQELGTM